jgi:predicted O-methyltransferase YrrM
LTGFQQPQNVLELGTNLGYGTLYLALAAAGGAPQADALPKLVSVEGHAPFARFATRLLATWAPQPVEVRAADFDTYLSTALPTSMGTDSLDLVLIDGNHTYQATLRYFQHLKPYMRPGGMMIFDDIHWSRGMQAAWQVIAADPACSVALDCYLLGAVWLGRPQAQEYFRISPLLF